MRCDDAGAGGCHGNWRSWVVGAVGDVMMTAWGCRDDEGREKAGKIRGARFRIQDSGFKIQRPTGAPRCLMEGGHRGREQASAEPHKGLEPSCDWRGWRGRRGWRDWQARLQVRFHLNATSRFVVGDRHWPATGCPPRLHKHLYCANLNQPKRRNALERGEPALIPIYPDTQLPIYPDTYRPSPP
jgi:hypothetical protein